MSPVRVTWNRTIGRARSLYSTAFAVGAFLAASAVLFAFKLDAAEGVSLSIASVWAMSVAPFLPALAAFLAMDVWSDELPAPLGEGGALGSAVHVTAMFGFALAGLALLFFCFSQLPQAIG